MDDRVQTINDRINEAARRHQDLQSLKDTHLQAIEECNQRLKELVSTLLIDTVDMPLVAPKIGDGINGMFNKTENLTINGHSYELSAPKFGRKKIAWT